MPAAAAALLLLQGCGTAAMCAGNPGVFNTIFPCSKQLLPLVPPSLLLLQGDGTAAMCAGNPGIFTLSVHAANNFPARKQTSSLDVPLPDGLGDDDYLAAVAEVRLQQCCWGIWWL